MSKARRKRDYTWHVFNNVLVNLELIDRYVCFQEIDDYIERRSHA